MMNKQTWLEMGWSTPGLPQQRGRYFKKDSAPAPVADPLIGQAASQNVALGKESLELSRQQWADSAARQDKEDALAAKVAQSALDTQDQSNKWAAEDRTTAQTQQKKYDGWADADRATGQDTLSKDQAIAADALESGKAYEKQFQQMSDVQNKIAAGQTGRYQTTFTPVEDKVANDAMNWDSAGRQENMAAEARGDALTAAQQGADSTQRQMMSMGVNPNSGRFATTQVANNTGAMLAAAGAQNAARDNVRMQGVQLRQQAAQLGQQVLGSGQQASSLGMQATGAAQTARSTGIATALSAQNQGLAAAGVGNTTAALSNGEQGQGYAGLGVGLQAGNAALGANGAANSYAASNNNAMMDGFKTSAGLNSSGAQIAQNLYGSQVSAYNAAQAASAQQSSGMMSAVGAIGGAAIVF